jgi:N-acyl-L-homoserine lactone synthetase
MIAAAAQRGTVPMIVVVKGSEKARHPELFDQHARLRTEVFAPGRGWIVPGAPGQPADPYDDDEAVYFLALDETQRVQASTRISPTVKSSLIADRFPHLVENGQSPRAPKVYERTHSVARRQRGSDSAHRDMIGAALQWCLRHGVAYLQTIIDYASLPHYLALTPLTTPMGLPHPYGGGRGAPGGGECLAVRWPICPQLLADVQNYRAPRHAADDNRRLH